MKELEAIRLYVKNTPQAQSNIKRLMNYEKGMTALEFANKCGITHVYAQQYFSKHGLLSDATKSLDNYHRNKRAVLVKDWDSGLTISGNAKKLKVCLQTARKMCAEHQLEYVHHQNLRPRTITRIKRIYELKSKGVRDSEIARMFSYSREYISQLCEKGKLFGIDK